MGDNMVANKPIGNGSNGRRADGRFAIGNPGGPGNPNMQRAGQIRRMICGFVTEKDLRDIVQALVEKAKGGDLPSIRELLDRLAGKPTQAADEHAGRVIHPHIGVADTRELTPEEQATLDNL